MNKLTRTDLHFVVSHLPKDVRTLMEQKTLILAGGFIRELIAGNSVQDIDLFGPSRSELSDAADVIQKAREGARLHKTKNAITLLAPPRTPIQFITRWQYDEVEALVKSFDFTVCQAAVYFDRGENSWKSCVHDDFYADLAARRLVYTFPVCEEEEEEEEVGGSILRMRKFLVRGYNIQAPSMAGMIARIALSLDMDKINACIAGETPELAATKVITGLLHEVDPFTVIDGIEMHDETQGGENAE